MKRLYKSRTDKKIDGVCAGIAEYFEVDPVLVRVLAVLLFVFGGVAVVAYIIGMIVIPRKPYELETESAERKEQAGQNMDATYVEPSTSGPKETDYSGTGALLVGIVLVVIGFLALADNLNIFSHFYFWRWITHNFWDFLIPGIFIVAGIALVTKSKKEQD